MWLKPLSAKPLLHYVITMIDKQFKCKNQNHYYCVNMYKLNANTLHHLHTESVIQYQWLII